jgi:hypothetical protein
VLEDTVDPHIECLRRWRGLCEGISNVGTVDAFIFEGAMSKEKAQTGLLHTGGVGVVKSTYVATTSEVVADTMGLFRLGSIGLDVVSPHPIENGGIGRSRDRVIEHTLFSELVELLVLARFPFRPVSGTNESSSRKFV